MTTDARELKAVEFAEPTGLVSVVGFFFAFRSFIVVLSVHLLGTEPRAGTALSLAVDYLLLLAVAFSSLGEAHLPIREMLRPASARWALFFLGFSGVSLLWSSTVSPATSIAYWCGMVADVAMVAMLLRAGSVKSVGAALMRGYVWGACAVAVMAWIMPAQSDLRLGDEELLGSNQIGYICGCAFFFAEYLMREEKRRLVPPSVLLAVTLLRTLSKTTLVAFLVGQGFLLIWDRSISRRTKIFSILAAGAVVAMSWGLLSAYYDIYTSAGDQSTTLTGRVGIWAYVLAEAVEQPWIGHGFDSVWKVIPPFGIDQFEAAHAHNELLQQFYAYGLVGVGIFLGIYGSLYLQIRCLGKGSLRTFLFAFLLFVLVRGTADTERFDLSLPMWALVMFSLLAVEAKAEEPRRSLLAQRIDSQAD
jgi:exopolysaccharide production protein ExoQ